MDIQTLQQANALKSQIDSTQSRLNQVIDMLDDVKDPSVKTRVRGLDFVLPKAIFKGELTKQKKALEDELLVLETQFSAL